MGTDFGADLIAPDEGGDAGEFMDIPGDDGDAGESLSFAERMAAELGDSPSAEWFRNQGWQSPEEVEKSFRSTKAELTRLQQEYAATLDALRSSEQVPDQQGFDPAADVYGQAQQIAGLIDSGDVEAGQAMAHVFTNLVPQLVQAEVQKAIQENVAPVQTGLERMELDRALAEMEATYGAQEAKRLARQVMPMLSDPQLGKVFSTPQGIRQAFAAAYGQSAFQQQQRRQRAQGMETVDQSARGQRASSVDAARALEQWLLKP